MAEIREVTMQESRSRWDLEMVAELVAELYRAAWAADWTLALQRMAVAFEVGEVRVIAVGSRGSETVLASSTARGSCRRSLRVPPQRPVALAFDRAPGEVYQPLVRAIEDQLPAILALAQGRDDERVREAAARATLDRLEVGVIVLDERGCVAQVNQAARALLTRETAVRHVPGGGLEAQDPVAQREIARIVARMAGASHDPTSRLSEHVEIPRPGRQPLRLLAVPLHGEAELTGRACAVFLSDPDAGLDPPEDVLRRHYRLTLGESRVAARLLRGLGIDGVAGDLRVTRETVRSHVKRIYAKVGTTRQSDLVALVMRGPAGLRWE